MLNSINLCCFACLQRLQEFEKRHPSNIDKVISEEHSFQRVIVRKAIPEDAKPKPLEKLVFLCSQNDLFVNII